MSRRRAVPRTDDKRPPVERLRSLLVEPDRERSGRMMKHIRRELEETRAPGPWIAAARTLAAEGVTTENAVYYFVEIFLECITLASMGRDPEMVLIEQAMDELRQEHGLEEDEDWRLGEGPPEWDTLNDAWNARDDAIRVETLRALGHPDLAEALERDREGCDERESAGYFDVWGVKEGEDGR